MTTSARAFESHAFEAPRLHQGEQGAFGAEASQKAKLGFA
jgi:hypothetical protein